MPLPHHLTGSGTDRFFANSFKPLTAFVAAVILPLNPIRGISMSTGPPTVHICTSPHYEICASLFNAISYQVFFKSLNLSIKMSLKKKYHTVIPRIFSKTRIQTPGRPPIAQMSIVARLYPRSGLPIHCMTWRKFRKNNMIIPKIAFIRRTENFFTR